MSARVATEAKARWLFVDDEKRVLNSMRAMFRRDYELFLTTRGDEALKIIAEQPIDVLVADQRMPIMTGVEVLSAARKCSPGTVRILLTGYSDLDAIEGAMNDGEVFRFLNKPCAATELRGTISEAAQIARDTADQARSAAQGGRRGVTLSDVEALSSRAQSPLARPAKINGARIDGQAAVSAPAPRRTAVEQRPANARVAPTFESHPAPDASNHDDDSYVDTTTMEIVMAGDTVTVVDHSDDTEHAYSGAAAAPAPEPADIPAPAPTVTRQKIAPVPTLQPPNRITCVGKGKYNISVMVFSPDDQFARATGRALDGTFYTFHATNAVRLIEGIARIAPAVLITDVSTDPEVIQNLTAMLKKKLPALVTLVAGKHRDANVMISLINHGQVFRFVDKPLSSAACQSHVREALKRHIVLRKNPQLAQRYSVRENDATQGRFARLSERIAGSLGRVRKLWGFDRES
ncbi:MAG: response regulator [Gammaproteobacteria bacterium]|nr:response regulator [Gammaproteobacteria bacterium]